MVEGNSKNGDVLMDITGNFHIQNITFKPAPGQIGIVQHSGLTTMEKVTITGNGFSVYYLKSIICKKIIIYIHYCRKGRVIYKW